MISTELYYQLLAAIAVGGLFAIARSLEQLISLLKVWHNEITPKLNALARDLNPEVPPYLKNSRD